MGYSSSQKGYILFCLESKKFFVSYNVKFVEDVFPFRSPSDEFLVLFPPTPEISDSDFLIISFPTSIHSSPINHSLSTPSAIPTSVSASVSTSPPSHSPTLPVVEPRRSSRTIRSPSWLQSYIHPYQSTSSVGVFSTYTSSSHFPLHTHAFVSSLANITETISYSEARKSPHWIQAM
ncbi:hypothetical protein V6Z11_A04G050300 [Gossypium hirsutum]